VLDQVEVVSVLVHSTFQAVEHFMDDAIATHSVHNHFRLLLKPNLGLHQVTHLTNLLLDLGVVDSLCKL